VQIASLIADAKWAVADDGNPKGPLVIGSVETTAGLRLPEVLADFAKRYPEVDLELATGTTCELVDSVLAHRLEGAFVCGPANPLESVGSHRASGRNGKNMGDLQGHGGYSLLVLS
jgi:LysR family transcriptional regulator, cell division regulator